MQRVEASVGHEPQLRLDGVLVLAPCSNTARINVQELLLPLNVCDARVLPIFGSLVAIHDVDASLLTLLAAHLIDAA